MKFLIPTFFCFFFQLSLSHACSCFGPDNFCETIEDQPQLIILKGKKLNDVAHGMDFEVTEVLQGEESESVVRIWGDVGHLCRLYVSGFDEGQELILALYRHEEPLGDWGGDWADLEEVGDYYLSFCGVYYVLLEDEEGVAAAEECLGDISKDCLYPALEVFPLPADNELFVKAVSSPEELQIGSVELFDISGKKVASWTDVREIWDGELLNIDVSRFQAGIYFLRTDIPMLCSEQKMKRIVIF